MFALGDTTEDDLLDSAEYGAGPQGRGRLGCLVLQDGRPVFIDGP